MSEQPTAGQHPNDPAGAAPTPPSGAAPGGTPPQGQPPYPPQPTPPYPGQPSSAGPPPGGQPYPPQPYVPYPGQPYEDPNAKSRVAAGVLGILLGSLGIHRFYLGYTGLGLTMLLISVLSFGLLAGFVSIWGIVEGVLYLTDKTGGYSRDAQGRPLRS